MTPITSYRVRARGITFETTDARDAMAHRREGAQVTAVTESPQRRRERLCLGDA